MDMVRKKATLFLREEIAANDFQKRGADIAADEIFISDGSKCDTGNFQELFALDTKIAVPDPVYPVYIDTNVMAGRTGSMNNGRYDNILIHGKRGLKTILSHLCPGSRRI